MKGLIKILKESFELVSTSEPENQIGLCNGKSYHLCKKLNDLKYETAIIIIRNNQVELYIQNKIRK